MKPDVLTSLAAGASPTMRDRINALRAHAVASAAPADQARVSHRKQGRSAPVQLSECPEMRVNDHGFVLTLPGLRLDVTPNSRLHWGAKQRRVRSQRATVAMGLRWSPRVSVSLPCAVTIVRVSQGRPMDGDNLIASAKGVRDETAAWLGVDDSDARVTWSVRGERGPWGVKVEVIEGSGER